MNQSTEERFRQVMSGSDVSTWASLLRAAASCVEPFYAGLMRLRNALYDEKIFRARNLRLPAISVGNLTTGGTGKTPVVRWLGDRFRAAGLAPAVLMRGYKSTSAGISDEQAVLAAAGLTVIVDPNRIRGAANALARFPATKIFILDDAMQHRRAKRNFDLVLIHAAEPFGFNRVFPRGLLREPLTGLKRADAVTITHADEVTPQELDSITFIIRRVNSRVPIFHCDHVISGLRSNSGLLPIESLSGKKYFAFCGIGSPASFFWRLSNWGGTAVGTQALDDHHDYTQLETNRLVEAAKSAGAEMLITTAKDWVKLERFAAIAALPIYRAELSLRFWQQQEEALLKAILAKLT
jgi:tetraacyldisaccharide 4'-kinase